MNTNQINAVLRQRVLNNNEILISDINKILNKISKKLNKNNAYYTNVSSGQGNKAEIFWIAFFNTKITKRASKGYYIVILYDSKLENFFLTIAQSINDYPGSSKKIFEKMYDISIKLYDKIMQESKSKNIDIDYFNSPFEKIDLKAKGITGKSYENSVIISKKFDILNYNESDLLYAFDQISKIYMFLTTEIARSYDEWSELIKNTVEEKIKEEEAYTYILNDFSEGKVFEQKLSRYERSSSARKKCLAIHGYSCDICQINFEERYGLNEFIHVHHKVMLSSKKTTHVIDPEKDLVPLCPNCHAVVHSKLYKDKIKFPDYDTIKQCIIDSLKNDI